MEAFLEDCVQRLEAQTRELGAKLMKIDEIARAKVIAVCFDKITDFIDVLRLRSTQAILNDEEDKAETIELTIKTMKTHAGELEDEETIKQYEARQNAHEEQVKILNMVYPELMEDYLRRVLGVFIHKRTIQDEMHNKRAIFTLRHATKCFKTKMEAEILQAKNEEELKEKITSELYALMARNVAYMGDYRLNNIKVNHELLEEATRIILRSPAEGFGP